MQSMDASEERENDYLRFLRGMRPEDASIQASMPDLSTSQASELDFRTTFVETDGLTEIDHDGAEFARLLLAQAEQEQKETDLETDEVVVAVQTEVEEAHYAVDSVLHLSDLPSHNRAQSKPLASTSTDAFVLTKKSCRFYNRERERCKRAATGLDGRCAIHKISQFCKHPKCNKYNQGNGFCIKHGGGKKCKHDGCEKQVQGYGYCSGHGGKPLCPVEGCENKRMEGGFCKAHGGGRFCQHEGCKRRDIGGGLCISHGGGKKCNVKDCTKVDRGGGFCKAHGGGKKCESDNCRNWALGGGICPEHKGPGKRCKMLGCTKYDLGGGFCIAHGGGRKCVVEGCDKIRQVNKRCRGHGGKVLCCVPNCDRAAQNRKLCKAHGGTKLCQYEGCTNKQKGKGMCIRHGGGTRCKVEGCNAIQRGGGYCKGHGGGKKCSYTFCKKWVVGGGYCDDHLDLELSRQSEEISRIAASTYLANEHYILVPNNRQTDAQNRYKNIRARCKRTMLRSSIMPALVLLCFASAESTSPAISYRTYAEMTRFLLELNTTFPDIVQVSVAQETYGLPYPKELQCIEDDEFNTLRHCKQYVVHLTNHSTVANDPKRPEVFISGALHGDERIGPNAAIELVALFAYGTSMYSTQSKKQPTVSTRRWLKELINTRNILVMPMTNAHGYSHHVRKELEVDPNRDYNYMRSQGDCMQAMTSRVVNEIWRDHIFQLAVTFHAGTRAVAYEWGSPDHYLNGSKENMSEKSPDHMAQLQISSTLAKFAGVFPDGQLFPTGTMNDVVYGVTGGMEDWGYAASWENQFYKPNKQPFRPCEPTTFGGYPKEKTIYNNITHRAFNMLVETSNKKEPQAKDLGFSNELYEANVDFFRTEDLITEVVGHVPRNVRLALMMIELVQPMVRWIDGAKKLRNEEVVDVFPAISLFASNANQVMKMGCSASAWMRNQVATCNVSRCSILDTRHSKVQLAWEVLGALTVDRTLVQISSSKTFEEDAILMETTAQAGITRRFYSFTPNASQTTPDTNRTSLFVECINLNNVTLDRVYVRAVATVDQTWKDQGTEIAPQVPPQSHLVNARTNPDWDFEWNGHRVKGVLEWSSSVITIKIIKDSEVTETTSSNIADTDSSPSLLPSASFESDSDSSDSDGSAYLPLLDTGLTVEVSNEYGDSSDKVENDSGDSSGGALTTLIASSSPDSSVSYNSEGDVDSHSDKFNDKLLLNGPLKGSRNSRAVNAQSSATSTEVSIPLATTGTIGGSNSDSTPSSGLQRFGFMILIGCAMIIVLTVAFLYRRVFRRPRQPYMNISSLEQPTRSIINSIDDEDYDGNDDDTNEGPRIARHAQTSRSVL
ncbi:hypothetical protein CCR75_005692 [Bremia lactucae]|uniref:Peptidase M14 domain-containing protein n=1 Tax=Bremia lactucae TaxID=4779 RepID=A0A976IB44_BRELC|nr:hypothetical protein CCR75_005692 [Bremia lactucae]